MSLMLPTLVKTNRNRSLADGLLGCCKALTFGGCISVLWLLTGCQTQPPKGTAPTYFQRIAPDNSGVHFANILHETDSFNIITYLYFYNGGGVAVGDINNDGWEDIYAVSNQGDNALYLNKGNFKFEDISRKAQVQGTNSWDTGVAMADVNADGWLDIYVCSVSGYLGWKGHNLLYINNKDNTFTERAAEYGLDFSGFSTAASFFDYDNDGDLDLFLLNHAVHTAASFVPRTQTLTTHALPCNDILYENKKGHFTDISAKAGLVQTTIGYGLGVSTTDFNNDGWADIYVSNDFHEDDYLYENQKNGTFKEVLRQKIGHTSRFSMGNDAADINNDGYDDLLTLDMLAADPSVQKSSQGDDPLQYFLYKLEYGYYQQYARNALQLNQRGKYFAEVAWQYGIAATDWSWAPLFADFDKDGWKDLFITNGIARRPNDLDYIQFISDNDRQQQLSAQRIDTALLHAMPSGKVANFLYLQRNETYTDASAAAGFTQKDIANGAAYADLDNDGGIDLIVNHLNAPLGIYKNNFPTDSAHRSLSLQLQGDTLNPFGVGAQVWLYTPTQPPQKYTVNPYRGFESSVSPILHIGVGAANRVDSVVVRWRANQWQVFSDVAVGKKQTLRYSAAACQPRADAKPPTPLVWEVTNMLQPSFQHKENYFFDQHRERLIPYMASTQGPAACVGDVNGDGLADMYIGGAKYQTGVLYLQRRDGRLYHQRQAEGVFQKDARCEDVDAAFFDANGDGALDLYVASGGNEAMHQQPELLDRLYINDKKGNFHKDTTALPPLYAQKAFVRPFDFDNDGDTDLCIGGRVVSYHFGESPPSFLLQNDGKGKFSDVTAQWIPDLAQAGMLTDALWWDIDADQDTDLIVCGEWMPVTVFRREATTFVKDTTLLPAQHGWWQRLYLTDYNQDEKLDLIATNLGENNNLQVQPGFPLYLYIKDIDNNGAIDHFLATATRGVYYPYHNRDEIAKQVPSIKKQYLHHKDFAARTFDELFGKQLTGARKLHTDIFSSVVFLQKTKNSFTLQALPAACQVAPIFGITQVQNTLLMGGNFKSIDPFQGIYDANLGMAVIQGHTPQVADNQLIGWQLGRGEVRKIVPMILRGQPHVWVIYNNAAPRCFRVQK